MKTIQINDEYCWMHLNYIDGGGWTCMHPDCLSPEAIRHAEKQVVAELQEIGYDMRHVGKAYICQSPVGFVYEIKYVDQLMDQLLFAKAPLPLELLNNDVISNLLESIMPDVEADRAMEDATEKRRTVDASA